MSFSEIKSCHSEEKTAAAIAQPETEEYQVVKVTGTDGSYAAEKAAIESVVTEMPWTIFLNGQELITMLAMPGEEEYLVTGFLATEGIIKTIADLKSMQVDAGQGVVKVETASGETMAEKMFLKRYLTACCGKGRSSFYFANDVETANKVKQAVTLTAKDVVQYSDLLERRSELFQRTGGVHSGALAADGKIVFFSQDIGRHNVFDKLYGRCLREHIPVEDKIIVFSGRVSSEILLKVSKMNIGVIIARSAPTTLAVDMAEELGITLIGFARGQRFTIYTHPARVTGEKGGKGNGTAT